MAVKMDRILVISTMYPSKRHPTFGIFIKNQVEALRSIGFHVDVIPIRDPRMSKLFVLKKYLAWIFQVVFILLTKGKKYDIVHAHYIFPSGWLALLFKRFYRTRIVVTAHGGDIDKMANKGQFFFNRTRQVLHEADHVIAVGIKLKIDMVAVFKVSEDKISLLNMGVNRQIFRPMDQKEMKNALNLSPSSITILYVGNLIRAKGLEELVESYLELKSRHKSMELHLIGNQKEPLFVKMIKNKILEENIKDIVIHPAMAQKEIARWLAAADVFVIPSHMEGFGLVALEAMSCHTPVVGSSVGGLRYLLNDGAGVLIEPKNISSLSMGIESVLTNDNLRKAIIANGEKKAQMFNQESLLYQLIKIYQE